MGGEDKEINFKYPPTLKYFKLIGWRPRGGTLSNRVIFRKKGVLGWQSQKRLWKMKLKDR